MSEGYGAPGLEPGGHDAAGLGGGEDVGSGAPDPGMPEPGTPPAPETLPPEMSSLPPADLGSVSPEMQQVEAEVIAEERALEQEISQQYPVDPQSPPTGGDPAHPAHATTPDPSTAPVDLTMDSSGRPEQGTAPTDHVIGDPNADASQWSFQGANGYCGPNSISMLLESATGQHLTEQQVASWAISNDEMTRLPPQDDSPPGEPSLHYGMLPSQAADALNAIGGQYGISAHLEQGNLGDLETSLKDGHEVMIELDDQRIWHQPGVADTNEANHFVVVTGIDPSTGTVFLNDPGNPDGKEESIPLKEFESAWSISDNAMIVTSTSGSSGGGVDSTAAEQPGPILLPVVLSRDQLT
jgi:hypothetical protein